MLRVRLPSPLGDLVATVSDAGLHGLAIGESLDGTQRVAELAAGVLRTQIEQLEQALAAYFAGDREALERLRLPLIEAGTPFQRRVWAALRAIPPGEVRTYGEIAKAVGNPQGARAVGMACNRNPILLVTPCHRVVGANGALGGFGCGIEAKVTLLTLEGVLRTLHLDT